MRVRHWNQSFTQRTLWRLLFFLSYPLSILGANINDAFKIASGTTSGGCGNYIDLSNPSAPTGALADIWADSISLNNEAIKMMNAALTNDASRKSEVLRARRLVATFFGTEMDYEEILLWYNDVGALLGGNTGSRLYFLFCNGDYEEKQKASQKVMNKDGNPTGLTLAQAFPNLDFRSYAPFWIPSEKIYVVDLKSHNPTTYCNQPDSLGLTQHGVVTITVLLCPDSFATSDSISQRLGKAVSGPNQDIQLFGCTALTFYHELFHAVHPRKDSGDTTGYGARNIIHNALAVLEKERNGKANANSKTLAAPENYTWFALAAWYFYQQNVFFDAGQSQIMS